MIFSHPPELFEVRMGRRRRILLRGVHTTVENGFHRLRVRRERRGQLCGFRADLLVHIFQLDHIRLVHWQRRLVFTMMILLYYYIRY
jgi:hypothetical protein